MAKHKSTARVQRPAQTTNTQKQKTKQTTAVEQLSVPNIAVSMWIFLMLTVFPLFFHNYYFDILASKYNLYCGMTGVMLIVLLSWGLMSGHIVRWFMGAGREIKQNGFIKWFKQTYNMIDKFVILFFVIISISTLTSGLFIDGLISALAEIDTKVSCSSMMYAAFSGVEGRSTGWLLLAMYCTAYFCVTRFFRFRRDFVTWFLGVGIIICLFGITDYFNMDLLGFRVSMKPEQMALFTSTIGNINTYTTYVGFCIALAGTLFVTSTEKAGRIVFYFIALAISFIALSMGNSDNGYLTLIAFFGLLPLAAFRKKEGIRRYVLIIALFFTDIKVIDIIDRVMAGKVLGINGLFNTIADSSLLMPLITILWLVCLILYTIYFYSLRSNKKTDMSAKSYTEQNDDAPHFIVRAWAVLLGVGFAAVIILFVYINTRSSVSGYDFLGGLKQYFVFSDTWGTNRGYIWRAAITDYSNLPFIHKIFGTGPDTFGTYMMARYADMTSHTGQIYDSAHNEYLQYLFTIGPIGLVAYLGFLGSTFVMSLKKTGLILSGASKFEKEAAAYLTAFAFVIICYAFQATVNLNLPISTPIFWVFLMMTGSMIRRKDRDQ